MSSTQGSWLGPWKTPGNSIVGFSNPANPGDDLGVFVIHAILLSNGNVIMWSGHAETVHYNRECVEWDPKVLKEFPLGSGTMIPDRDLGPNVKLHLPPSGIDIFCCHQVHLPDGRILTMGGAGAGPHGGVAVATSHGRGIKDICVFDPASGWEKVGEMNEGRWYPTPVVMPDGKIVLFSGRTEDAPSSVAYTIAESVELIEIDKIDAQKPNYTPKIITILKPDAAATTAAAACRAFPTYPGMQLAPDGKIYHVGPNWRYERTNRSGTASANVLKVPTAVFAVDTKKRTGSWSLITEPGFLNDAREEGTCVLLPPAQDGKILVLGGARMTGDNHAHITPYAPLTVGSQPKSAHILDTLSVGGPSYIDLPDMTHARINVNPIILPDSTVLIIGGHDHHKWETGSTVSKICEIFNPTTNSFSVVDSLTEPRTYHSAALLLTDGSVMVAGGVDPTRSEPVIGGALNIKTFEIYRPPYFFKGTRPTIVSISKDGLTSATDFDHGDDLIIDFTVAAGANISEVGLMRLGAMTHHTDSEQRYVEVSFNQVSPLQCTIPADPMVLPPGPYMVWIKDDEDRPCEEAPIISISIKYDENGVVGSLDIPEGAPTTATASHNGKNYVITSIDGIERMLMVDGTMVHTYYFPVSKTYVSHHISFARFNDLTTLAQYIIDNDITV